MKENKKSTNYKDNATINTSNSLQQTSEIYIIL
jgi:hypothetical protein